MDLRVDESNDASYSSDPTCDTANFECDICFKLAQEPAVTLCGHLYCWSCLCQWLQIHSHSHECPVCKALGHEEKLIPIYGRGKTSYDLNLDRRLELPFAVKQWFSNLKLPKV